MTALGYNYRLSDIACAQGISQLGRLEASVARRGAIAERYGKALAEIPAVEMPHVRPEVQPAWHLYCIRLRLEKLTADRAHFFFQAEDGIRGPLVTGVQTCALPIYCRTLWRRRRRRPANITSQIRPDICLRST